MNCLLFIDKMERLERTHGIGSRDGFLLQWYWTNFKGLRSCCIPSCVNRDLYEMNFRCVTSLVSKSRQPAIGHIRCNNNMIFWMLQADQSVFTSCSENVIYFLLLPPNIHHLLPRPQMILAAQSWRKNRESGSGGMQCSLKRFWDSYFAFFGPIQHTIHSSKRTSHIEGLRSWQHFSFF